MAVVTTNPRVTAADPGAWLDGEPWTFTLTFNDPPDPITKIVRPTDLTGSRLYVQFQAQGPAGLVPIQICDSAAGDGSLTIASGTDGQIAINAVPEARTWTAPRFGPGLLLLPALVFGDVYRQVQGSDPVCLTRLTLRVLPTTGAPTGIAPTLLAGQILPTPSLTGAVTAIPAVALSGSLAAHGVLTGTPTVATVTPVALMGAVQASSALIASITVTQTVGLSGAIASSASLGGNLLIAVALSGSVPGTGVLSGAVGSVASRPVTGAIPAPTGPSGALSVAGTYAGAIAGAPSLTAALSTAVALSGTVAATPALGGALTTIAPTNFNGTIPSPVGPQGSATLTPGLVNASKGRLMAAAAA